MFQLVDTAGQERFNAVTSSFFRGVEGVMLVYDVTNSDSFNQIPFWLQQVNMYCGGAKSVLLIGNKSDLASGRVIQDQTGRVTFLSFLIVTLCFLWL